MKRKIGLIAIITAIVFGSCNSMSKTADKVQPDSSGSTTPVAAAQDVPYTIAQHYFVNNTYHDGDLVNPKISSQEEFDKLFGPAAVMGKNGPPTNIDFSKQYVIAVIGKLTDRGTSITISSLKQKGNVISLTYKLNEGEKGMSIIRPAILIIVDQKYQGEVKLVESHDQN